VFFKTLYAANLNGSGLRPLTVVRSDGGVEPVRRAHTSPRWSPSGKWIAFGSNQQMGDWGGQYAMRCEALFVVSSDAAEIPIDTLKPNDAIRLATPAGNGRGVQALGACGGQVGWIAR
jgi:Tol biopolymer transport system component